MKLVNYFQYWAGMFIPIGLGLLIWGADLSERINPLSVLVIIFGTGTIVLGLFCLWLAYNKLKTAEI